MLFFTLKCPNRATDILSVRRWMSITLLAVFFTALALSVKGVAAITEESIGTYQGMLEDIDATAPNEPVRLGRFTVKVTSSGRFTGVLNYRGLNCRMAETFSAELKSEITLSRRDQSDLIVKLELIPASNSITVEVEENLPTTSSSGLAQRHEFHARTNPAGDAARYTMRFASTEVAKTFNGYACVNVTKGGLVVYLGRLSDGTRLNGTALLRVDDTAVLHDSLYRPVFPLAGQWIGEIHFDRTLGTQAVTGAVEWQVPDGGGTTISEVMEATGSVYERPGPGERVIESATGSLIFTSSEPVNFSTVVQLTPSNRFQVAEPNTKKLRLTIALGTGEVRGSFFDSQVNRTRTLRGVVLQAQRSFRGYYLTEVAGGTWRMEEL